MSDGVQSGWRVIFDLSAPDGQSVNDGIPKEYGAIVYESVEDAMLLVARASRGARMMKHDRKSTLHHIPVSQLDHWLLIFEWEGQCSVDIQSFLRSLALDIHDAVSLGCHALSRQLPGGISPQRRYPHALSSIRQRVLAMVSLTKAPEKDSEGTTVSHLGFEFDSMNMEVWLPPNKRLRALRAVH